MRFFHTFSKTGRHSQICLFFVSILFQGVVGMIPPDPIPRPGIIFPNMEDTEMFPPEPRPPTLPDIVFPTMEDAGDATNSSPSPRPGPSPETEHGVPVVENTGMITNFLPDLRPTPPPMPRFPNVFTDLDSGMTTIQKVVHIEGMICSSECDSSQEVREAMFPKCQVCHCDPGCVATHTCCPDKVLNGDVVYTGQPAECVPMMSVKVNGEKLEELQNKGKMFSSMITKCQVKRDITASDGNDNFEEDRMKCEHLNLSIPDQSLPVSDPVTTLTYRNIYCARCNNVEQKSLYVWNTNIDCEGNMDALLELRPNKRELFEILTSVAEVEKTACQLIYKSEHAQYYRECRLPLTPVIDTCNQTGHWPAYMYDVEIEMACHMYTSLFLNKYKNMFCFLCNVRYISTFDELFKLVAETGSNPGRLSFASLFDFNPDGEEQSYFFDPRLNCSATQVYDNSTCQCKDLECSKGKYLDVDNMKCETLIHSKNIGFEGCIEVEIEFTSPPDYPVMRELPFFIERMQVRYKWVVTISEWCPFDSRLLMHLQIWEIPGDSGKWDTIGDVFQENGHTFCNFFKGITNVSSNFRSCNFRNIEKCPDLTSFSMACETGAIPPFHQTVLLNEANYDDNEDFYDDDEDDYDYIEEDKLTFLKFRNTNPCLYVEISMSDFNVSYGFVINLKSGMKVNMSKVDSIKNDTAILICVKDFEEWTQIDTPMCYKMSIKSFIDHWTTAGLISIITSCISLLFLLFTLITYILFKSIRAGGGKGIMVTTVLLFVAIALYEFAIEQYENKTLCSIFGVLIHYFWLASVFSMNACTLERFAKLCFPLESRNFFLSKKPFKMALTYTLVGPLIIVGLNIGVNFALKGEIDYGSRTICYINERYALIFSFVVPIFMLVFLNITLFITMVAKLRRNSHPGDNKSSQSKIGLIACVRLSVITGATWLIFLLYEIIRVEAMGYIFTLLIGLQGVVFFFSTVGNKKVFDLYIQTFGIKRSQRGRNYSSGSGSADSGNKRKDKTDSGFDSIKGPLKTDETEVSLPNEGDKVEDNRNGVKNGSYTGEQTANDK